MKKFMKVCGITALILLIVGFAVAACASTVRGRTTINEVLRAITGGRVNLAWDDWSDAIEREIEEGIKEGIKESIAEIKDVPSEILASEGYYDIDEYMDMFDKKFTIWSGDVEKYSLGSDVVNLDVEIGGCELWVLESPDENFYVEARNASKMQSYVKDHTLHVKSAHTVNVWGEQRESVITLFIPAGFVFDEIDLEVGAGLIDIGPLFANEVDLQAGAGNIEVDYIQANKLDVSAGAGAVSVYDMQVQELDGEIGVGYMYLEGDVGRNASLECSMGSIEAYINGSQEDFNYELECGMGSVELGNDSYVGLAREKSIYNQASKNMDLECSMGSIVITFAQ